MDVFTDRPFAGNPLAVVFGADALATEQMQALATRVQPVRDGVRAAADPAGATYRARIFTPAGELPFAGHPERGRGGHRQPTRAVRRRVGQQECGAGLLPIEVTATGSPP